MNSLRSRTTIMRADEAPRGRPNPVLLEPPAYSAKILLRPPSGRLLTGGDAADALGQPNLRSLMASYPGKMLALEIPRDWSGPLAVDLARCTVRDRDTTVFIRADHLFEK